MLEKANAKESLGTQEVIQGYNMLVLGWQTIFWDFCSKFGTHDASSYLTRTCGRTVSFGRGSWRPVGMPCSDANGTKYLYLGNKTHSFEKNMS